MSLEAGDLKTTGGRNSRLKMAEQSVQEGAGRRRARLSSAAAPTSATIPHGIGADQFVYFVKWGMTPVQALQTAVTARGDDVELSLGTAGWQHREGQVRRSDRRVRATRSRTSPRCSACDFVMKGGLVTTIFVATIFVGADLKVRLVVRLCVVRRHV